MSKNYVVIKEGNQECIPITEKKAVIGLESDLTSIDNRLTSLEGNAGGGGNVDISGKEDVSNKVTSWSSTTTDTHYPSEKLVSDSLGNKQDTLISGTNIKTINGTSILGSGDITVGSGGVLVQEQANWNESNSSNPSYIQNKPTNLEVTSNKVTNKNQFTNSLTNDQYLSAKVVYEIVGDVESLLAEL